MLAYTASRPVAGTRQSSPNALLLVISAHVALVAAVMSAKMDLPQRILPRPPITIIKIPSPAPVPPERHVQPPRPQPITNPSLQPPLRPPFDTTIDTIGPIDTGPVIGGGGNAIATGPSNPIKLVPIRHEPQLLTPFSELKPPYPASKLAAEEEAVLTLRLSIDDQGRVVAVDSVGRADKIFVDAARRHMIAHWRYAPATQDGEAISSSITVTMRFMLDG